MALTTKQEQFAQNVAIKNMSYKDAYKDAYNTNASEQVLYNNSSQLALNEEVQARIKSIRKQLETTAKTSVISETERIKALLWERIEICRNTGDENAIARYTDQLNKLNGSYKDITKPEDKENTFNDLDMDNLIRITSA